MATQRHLRNAPIAEALFDIQVTPREGLTFAQLKGAIDEQDFGYYVKNPISEGKISFSLASDGQPNGATQNTLHEPLEDIAKYLGKLYPPIIGRRAA